VAAREKEEHMVPRRQAWWLGSALLVVVLVSGMVIVRRQPARVFAGPIPVGLNPQEVALDARTGYAFVTNSFSNSVSMLDIGSGVVLHTITVVPQPEEVAVDSHTSRAFVVNNNGDVSVLDTTTGVVLRTLNIEPSSGGLELCNVVVAPRADRVLVVMGNGDTPGLLTVLDARLGIVLHQVPVGRYAHTVAVDERTGRVFTANITDSTVSVLDLESGRVLRTVGVRAGPLEVAVDEQTGRAFVTNADRSVSVLDTRNGSVLRTVAVDGSPTEVSVDAVTGRAFVLLNPGVATLDARTGALLHTVAVGTAPDKAIVHNPQDLVVDARTSHVFVTEINDAVSVLDARSGRVLGRLPAGQGPVALALDEAHSQLLAVNPVGAVPQGAGRTPSASEWAWVPQGLRHWLPWLSAPPPARLTTTGGVTVLDASHV